ncbi:MAG: hypothetical protein E7311_01810 [Clostridiales bacterium]|nr:hypothetical protein [Clostridiales bacterium]
MFKNKKILIGIIIIICIVVIIGILCIININSKKRIAANILEYINDSIVENNDNITKEYIDNNISKVDKESATQMITLYEEYQDNQIEKLYNEFKEQILKYNYSFDVDSLNNIENIQSEQLKNIIEKIRNNGYKFKKVWGDIIIVKDYSQFTEYTEYVSEDKKIYLNIQNNYETQLYLYKDITSLLNTIIETENSIKKIKDTLIKEDAIEVYGNMLLLVIEGDEIYVPKAYGEEDNIQIISEIQTCISENANTVTANILNSYVETLKQDNYEYRDNGEQLTSDIRNNISSYFK